MIRLVLAVLAAGGLAACASALGGAGGSAPAASTPGPAPEKPADDPFLLSLFQHPQIVPLRKVMLSPDAGCVIYHLREYDIPSNANESRWVSAAVTPDGLSDAIELPLPANLFWLNSIRMQWLSEDAVSYFNLPPEDGAAPGLYRLDVATGAQKLILAPDALGEGVAMQLG